MVAHEEKEDKPIVPRVPFSACVEKLAAEAKVEGFYSTAVKGRVEASQRVRFKTFPPHLVSYFRR